MAHRVIKARYEGRLGKSTVRDGEKWADLRVILKVKLMGIPIE